MLEQALAALLVTDVEAPPYYSLRIGAAGGRRRRAPIHFLYDGTRDVLATRDLRRLLSALVGHVAGHVLTDAGILRLKASAAVTTSGAVLAPAELLSASKEVERDLQPTGIAVVDASEVRVDPSTAELVVDPPPFPVDWSAVHSLPSETPQPGVAPGRYPLLGWLIQVGQEAPADLGASLATLHATRLVQPPLSSDAQWALDSTAALVREVRPAGIRAESGADLVAAVGAALRAG